MCVCVCIYIYNIYIYNIYIYIYIYIYLCRQLRVSPASQALLQSLPLPARASREHLGTHCTLLGLDVLGNQPP